jgi:hypothetical protein
LIWRKTKFISNGSSKYNERYLPKDYDREKYKPTSETETLRFGTFEELDEHYKKLIKDSLDHRYLADGGIGDPEKVLINLKAKR